MILKGGSRIWDDCVCIAGFGCALRENSSIAQQIRSEHVTPSEVLAEMLYTVVFPPIWQELNQYIEEDPVDNQNETYHNVISHWEIKNDEYSNSTLWRQLYRY